MSRPDLLVKPLVTAATTIEDIDGQYRLRVPGQKFAPRRGCSADSERGDGDFGDRDVCGDAQRGIPLYTNSRIPSDSDTISRVTCQDYLSSVLSSCPAPSLDEPHQQATIGAATSQALRSKAESQFAFDNDYYHGTAVQAAATSTERVTLREGKPLASKTAPTAIPLAIPFHSPNHDAKIPQGMNNILCDRPSPNDVPFEDIFKMEHSAAAAKVWTCPETRDGGASRRTIAQGDVVDGSYGNDGNSRGPPSPGFHPSSPASFRRFSPECFRASSPTPFPRESATLSEDAMLIVSSSDKGKKNVTASQSAQVRPYNWWIFTDDVRKQALHFGSFIDVYDAADLCNGLVPRRCRLRLVLLPPPASKSSLLYLFVGLLPRVNPISGNLSSMASIFPPRDRHRKRCLGAAPPVPDVPFLGMPHLDALKVTCSPHDRRNCNGYSTCIYLIFLPFVMTFVSLCIVVCGLSSYQQDIFGNISGDDMMEWMNSIGELDASPSHTLPPTLTDMNITTATQLTNIYGNITSDVTGGGKHGAVAPYGSQPPPPQVPSVDDDLQIAGRCSGDTGYGSWSTVSTLPSLTGSTDQLFDNTTYRADTIQAGMNVSVGAVPATLTSSTASSYCCGVPSISKFASSTVVDNGALFIESNEDVSSGSMASDVPCPPIDYILSATPFIMPPPGRIDTSSSVSLPFSEESQSYGSMGGRGVSAARGASSTSVARHV